MEGMPSQFEQDIAKAYCLCRKLPRPKTDIKRALLCAFGFVALSIALVLILSFVLTRTSSYIHCPLIDMLKDIHPILLWVLIVGIQFIFFLKSIVIGIIHLYQHYAHENVRRRCLFMPTCSEYMILAIKKYGVIIGGYKGTYRLFKRCRGNVYSIDYPYKHK